MFYVQRGNQVRMVWYATVEPAQALPRRAGLCGGRAARLSQAASLSVLAAVAAAPYMGVATPALAFALLVLQAVNLSTRMACWMRGAPGCYGCEGQVFRAPWRMLAQYLTAAAALAVALAAWLQWPAVGGKTLGTGVALAVWAGAGLSLTPRVLHWWRRIRR